MAAMRGFPVAALALAGLVFAWTPFAERLDLAALDAQFSFLRKFMPKPAPDDIVVVGVDDRTFKAIPEPLGMWHEPLGKVLEKVALARPRAIGLDVTLPDRSYDGMRPGLDRALMAGLVKARENGPLVAALSIDSRTQSARPIHLPFLAVLRDERLGITLFGRDSDGLTRRFSLAIPTEDTSFPTLVGRLCRALSERKCSDGLIDFALGAPFRYVPLHEVLKSEDPEYLGRLFRGRIVLIGETQRFSDRISVPVNLAGWETVKRESPGVVVHAAALRTALHGTPAAEPAKPVTFLLITAAACLVLMRDWRLAGAIAVPGAVLLFAGATYSLNHGQALAIAPALVTLAIAWMSRTAYAAREEREKRERLRTAFGGYVSPAVLRAILKGELKPRGAGERLDLAFLFGDLRGSTAMTAHAAPEDAMALLNRFHQVLAGSIHRNDGMLDNIRGDGVMAVFGAPKPLADPVKHAWAAAQDMFRGLDHLNLELGKEGKPPLSMVAGLAFGEAVVGHVGSSTRYNYTAVGDAANVAARMQEVAKKRGLRIVLAGQGVPERLPGSELKPLGAIQVDGTDPVEGWGWR